MNTIYLFEQTNFKCARFTSPFVIRGCLNYLTEYVSKKDLAAEIGGYVLWAAPEVKDERMPGCAIGVYGRREVAKFKGLLRKRGVNIIVIKGEGPNQRMTSITRDYEKKISAKAIKKRLK